MMYGKSKAVVRGYLPWSHGLDRSGFITCTSWDGLRGVSGVTRVGGLSA